MCKTLQQVDTSPQAGQAARPSARRWRAAFCQGPEMASAAHFHTPDILSLLYLSPLTAPYPGLITPNLLTCQVVHPALQSSRESFAIPCHSHAYCLFKRETGTPAKKLSGLAAIQPEVMSLIGGVLL